ncbi:MAG: PAS domain S-box protein [Acidobacteriota bacterium]
MAPSKTNGHRSEPASDGTAFDGFSGIFPDARGVINQTMIICVTDARGVYTYVNDLFCRLSGYSCEELLGTHASIVDAGHHTSGFFDAMYEAAGSGRLWRGEIKSKAKSGKYFWVDSTMVPMIDPATGRAEKFLSIQHDITEQKNAQRRLEAQHDVTAILAASHSLAEAIPRILKCVCEALEWEIAEVWQVDERAKVLRCVDFWHLPSIRCAEFKEIVRLKTFEKGKGIAGAVWQSGEALWIDNILLHSDYAGSRLALVFNMYSAVSFPIKHNGRVLGVVNFFSSRRQESDEPMVAIMDALGSQIGQFIERKLVEDELRASEERFRLISETMRDMVSLFTPHGELSYVSPSVKELLGYAPSDLQGMTPLRLLHPEDFRRVIRHIAGGAASMTETAIRHRLRHTDGSYVWFETMTQVVVDGSGTVIRYQTVSRDITKRRAAEEAHKEAAHRLGMIIESVQEGITLSDESGKFEIFNSKMTELTGYSLEEANAAKDFSLLLYPDEADRFQALDGLNMVIETGRGPETETTITTKCGERRTLLVSTSMVRFNERTMFLSAYRDITDRKNIEEELARNNEELFEAKYQAEVQAGVLQMQTQELIDAREAALEASRLKSEFVANMSHEIRTPMNGIIGMTGLLLESGLSSEQHEYVDIIRSSGEALLTIINDILDFSKIEAGKLTMETLDFSVRTTVEETVELMAHRAEEKKLELVCLVYNDVPPGLRGDPGRLRQILINLLGNSIKFTERGEVIVRVRKEEESETSVRLRFAITDTGIGISKDARERLFQPFMQADGSTTRKYGGTGLGLAISKQLVEMMHGEIGVESEIGKGSTFWFTAIFEKQQAAQQQRQGQRMALAGVRMLIVDDNATNRKVVHHQVLPWGILAGFAENARQALELLRSAVRAGTPYAIAALDMQMPEMNGLQLAAAIKADRELSATRLILLTSLGVLDKEELDAVGIETTLTKPVRQADLYNAIMSVVTPVPKAAPAPEPESVETDRSEFSHIRILVAEDNIVNQKVAKRMLEKLGCSADVVADGLEAVQAVANAPYDIVLMDCQMPEMDGFEATRQIRARETQGRHMTIVAMTANALQGDKERCLESGMDDYISKPVRHTDLLEMIRRWMPAKRETAPQTVTQADVQQQPAAGEAGIIDIKRLHELSAIGGEDEPELLRVLVTMYLNDSVKRIASIYSSLTAGDLQKLTIAAHTLKGSSGNMGVRLLVPTCSEIESRGKQQTLEGVLELYTKLEHDFSTVKAALEQFLKDFYSAQTASH